jgi:K+/H+ antiporter YhaU regulatory subunit KhtT
MKKSNKVIHDDGKVIVLDISTKKHPSATMKIDKKDYDSLKSKNIGRIYAWNGGTGTNYARAKIAKGAVIRVHRLMRPEWEVVDHINGDGTDNRSANLRECTQQQNCFNSKLKSTNTSGAAGVKQIRGKLWEARIMHNYQVTIIGYYKNKEDAIAARHQKESELFGEFAFINRKTKT